MMDFSPLTPKRDRSPTLLPMINVVFLLLIFFLIAARLAPPEPFPVTPPKASAEAQEAGDFALYLGADGRLGFAGEAGGDEDRLAALEQARVQFCAQVSCENTPPRLFLYADGDADVARLAGILPRLAQAGFARVEMVTTAPDRGE